MSRHRNVRSMNYSDEYEGFDDVYGHSVEDDYCISPSDAAFMYDRSQQQPAQISNFLAEEDDIAEEDERPVLNDLDEAKLQSCLDEVHTVVGDSVPENILIQTIVDCQFDLAKSLDTILKTQTSTQEEAPKPQRVRRQRPEEKDDKSVSYSSDKKHRKLKKSIRNLEAGDCVFTPSTHSESIVNLKQVHSKNVHRKFKNKFGLDKGYLHSNVNLEKLEKQNDNIQKLVNNPLQVKEGIASCVCKLNGFSVHSECESASCSNQNQLQEQLKHKMEDLRQTSSVENVLRNDLHSQPGIIKTSNLLERGIEIESVNCSLNSLDGVSSLTALAARNESEPSFSLDDMVSDLLKDDGSEGIENARSPKRPNSELEIDNQCVTGIKKALTSYLEKDEVKSNNIPNRDTFPNTYRYAHSIDSDDEDHFSLAHLAAKHEKSKNVKQEHDHVVLSLDDLVSKHFKSDDKFPVLGAETMSSELEESSLDALMSKHFKSNDEDSTRIANLTSKHLTISEPKSVGSTGFLNSPNFPAQSLFDGSNISLTNPFGNPNSSPKNIYGSPKISNTLFESPNRSGYNYFGDSNPLSRNNFGVSNSPKNSMCSAPNSVPRSFHLGSSSMSPKYFNFGSSEGSTKVEFEREERERTISTDSRDQEIFDDVDDVCFFEPTINLSSALLPSVIGESRSGKKTESGILNNKWTAELSSALNPRSDADVLIKQDDWTSPSFKEPLNTQPDKECCIDAKSILKVKLDLKAKKCSSFGKIICKKIIKSSLIPYKEEPAEKSAIIPFGFDTLSPDDEILKYFIPRQ